MASFASIGNIEARWRPLSTAEQTRAGTLLKDASAIIRANVPGIDAAITAGTTDPEVARLVAAHMVIRAMQMPSDGASSYTVSVDDFTQTRRYETELAALRLTADDLSLLTPGTVSVGAFTIRPAYTAPVAVNDLDWS